MRQLLYISTGRPGVAAEVPAIVGASLRNNRREGVTGLLWTDTQRFLQVLEGEDAAVHGVFDRIKRDPRHLGIVVLHDRAVEAREFGAWAMAQRGPLDSADTFDARMKQCLAGASPSVRGTFEGLIAARRAA